MEWIQVEQVDVVILSGEDIYMVGKMYGLVFVVGEYYVLEDSSNLYYVVVVVRWDSFYVFILDEFWGKCFCYVGFGSFVGWDVFVGVFIQRGFIWFKDCDVFIVVSEFFNVSCVFVNNFKNYFFLLCVLCVGDEQGCNKCVGNSQEWYYGYCGVFRCLVENVGDVVFVRYIIVFDNINGYNFEFWVVEFRLEDYELLCFNGV